MTDEEFELSMAQPVTRADLWRVLSMMQMTLRTQAVVQAALIHNNPTLAKEVAKLASEFADEVTQTLRQMVESK